jgi:hypothetical protein
MSKKISFSASGNRLGVVDIVSGLDVEYFRAFGSVSFASPDGTCGQAHRMLKPA